MADAATLPYLIWGLFYLLWAYIWRERLATFIVSILIACLLLSWWLAAVIWEN